MIQGFFGVVIAIVVASFIFGGDTPAEMPVPFTAVEGATSQQEIIEPVASTETITQTNIIPFSSRQVESSLYSAGETITQTQGSNGERTITYEISYLEGVEQSREEISNTVTKQPVEQVVAIGTYVAPVFFSNPTPTPTTTSNLGSNQQSGNLGGGCDPNYTPCIPVSSTDLNCGDISVSVRVIGTDIHNFDRDNDGKGCESN